jgi:hypothetical protein
MLGFDTTAISMAILKSKGQWCHNSWFNWNVGVVNTLVLYQHAVVNDLQSWLEPGSTLDHYRFQEILGLIISRGGSS